MSHPNPVRLTPVLAGLAVCGLMAVSPAMAGSRQETDSSRTGQAAKPADNSIAGTRSVTQREPIPYSTLRKATSQLRSGASRTVRNGTNGEKEVVFRVTVRPDGVELHREKLSEHVIKKPIDEIVEEGQRATLPSRGYFSGRRMLTMIPTTYDPYHCGGDGRGLTATGLKARYGVAAVDPRFIPLGTKLYVEGYGYAIAADTGGAIKGNRIDLCVDSKHQARGVRSFKKLHVYIID
ncbi:MAG TPA: G5 domain-containing protein [Chthonomonadaceae bacterium]|nr:G5 domain-containing protein [Chthonomonadaceae bacterium]